MEKHRIPDDWYAEFDILDQISPIIVIRTDQLRKYPALLVLPLHMADNETDEYPGCMIYPDKRTVVFKLDRGNDLTEAMDATA